ncbi:hypothetical protein Q8W71_24385 [Methylobacterium sp. NEAU 140]|uniref:hypothetical protein n=1 Tax=Methylobacterium sp. NEAU 140 TaxID=3064945 RepID=UPI002733E52A|nr:hypothetical protein [Methylobacterium sp. NEAU 140]MDP4025774.1 hypothetical protein [Methylobacterium sp. NEAU 140]
MVRLASTGGLLGALFGRRSAIGALLGYRSAIGAFSLPSARGCLSPSALADRLTGHARTAAFLAGAVFASLLAMMWLTYLCLKRAEVIPYVADGGVFGCQVQTVAAPRPLPLERLGRAEP